MLRLRFLGEASPGWDSLFEQAWTYLSAKRDPTSRGSHRRDLVRESWAPLYEYFGGLTAERLEGLALRVAQEIQRAFPALAEADNCMMGIIDIIMPQKAASPSTSNAARCAKSCAEARTRC